MDASDTGVCVLEPQLKQYIRVRFREAVRQTFADTKPHNSANVRELIGPALAALNWGPSTHTTGQQYDGGRWIQVLQRRSFIIHSIQVLPPFDDLLSLWETCSADMLSQVGHRGLQNQVAWRIGSWDSLLSTVGAMGGTMLTKELRTELSNSSWPASGGTTRATRESIRSPNFTVLLQGIKRLLPPVHKLTSSSQAPTHSLYKLSCNCCIGDSTFSSLRLPSVVRCIGSIFLPSSEIRFRIGQTRHFYCLKHQNVFFSDAEGKPTPEPKATSVTIGLEGAQN
ncbi:LOW QUALITY PROTEIN: hypothetical protein PHMEG_00029172 [Phytophthora megakarya]|uniref:Uncharacterized protein n=1 Tax=Phytophthora megakarya TaxID=4795 RepID=A0A225V3B6_9STRA|nr:LOW QUALITY PROTEIN: hypothetical protein PHMEG_00029172 [Phytophthora megakarya]